MPAQTAGGMYYYTRAGKTANQPPELCSAMATPACACLPGWLLQVPQLCQLGVQLRQQREEVAHQAVVSHLQDGRLAVAVDGHDHLAGGRVGVRGWGFKGGVCGGGACSWKRKTSMLCWPVMTCAHASVPSCHGGWDEGDMSLRDQLCMCSCWDCLASPCLTTCRPHAGLRR